MDLFLLYLQELLSIEKSNNPQQSPFACFYIKNPNPKMATKGYMVHHVTFLKYMLPFSNFCIMLLYFHGIYLYIVETCSYNCLGDCPPPPPPKKKGGGRRRLEKKLGDSCSPKGARANCSPKDACATCSPKGACAVCAAKALNQWGGAASPLIQRFRHVRRGVSINTSAHHQVEVDHKTFKL